MPALFVRLFWVAAFCAFLAADAPAPAIAANAGAYPEATLRQVEITDAQVKAYIAVQRELSGRIFRIGEEKGKLPFTPDRGIELVLRRSGFKDLGDYDLVARNIMLVLEGVDPATRSYVGADTMLKRQLADVLSDSSLSIEEKAIAKSQLDAELKALVPIRFPSNIPVVMGNLAEVMATSPFGAAAYRD